MVPSCGTVALYGPFFSLYDPAKKINKKRTIKSYGSAARWRHA